MRPLGAILEAGVIVAVDWSRSVSAASVSVTDAGFKVVADAVFVLVKGAGAKAIAAAGAWLTGEVMRA
jgi:hypothetical protein